VRIGINGLLLTSRAGYRQTGVSRYIERLISALPDAMSEAELLAYTSRGIELPADVQRRSPPFSVERPAVRIAWEHVALQLLARRDRLDLFHGPVNALPIGMPVPSVVTVHDLAFLRWKNQVTARRYRYLSWSVRRAVAQAAQVIAVSEATKQDLIDLLGLNSAKISVTPLGVDDRFQPANHAAVRVFRERRGLPRPYVLTVCTLEPRKNLPRLLEAFSRLRGELEHDLIIVGPEGWLGGELHETLGRLELRDRVRLTGFVPDDELPLWYNAADVMAFPSLYEGFGLPVLEAMACGTPVLTSGVSSLPEVAGESAAYVEPESVESIAAGIASLLRNKAERERMSRLGLARAKKFTWQRTAELTADVYRGALS
jgi:glycosyltransferase involved in cell wall biosynthesis